MNLRKLTDDQLLENAEQAANDERQATTRLLYHLAEIQRRRLFAREGCASLFDYCRRVLKMTDGHASRRINASRLLTEFPEMEDKLNHGALNLTSASQAFMFFAKEKKTRAEKMKILIEIEGQATRKVERILLSYAADPDKHFREKFRAVSELITQVTFNADAEAMADLEWLKGHWAHALKSAEFGAVIKRMAKICRAQEEKSLVGRVEKTKKALNSTSSETRTRTPAPEWTDAQASLPRPQKRYIPAETGRQVRARDGNCCTFVDERTGRKCGSKYKLQFDHIVPFAMGGTTDVENLRLRCSAHNQWHAIQTYGAHVLRFCD